MTRVPTVADAIQEAPPRGSLRLLADPTFGPYFLGRLLSTSGVWAHNITAAIVVYDLTASATLVGLVSVAQFAPQLLITPLAGARADRGDRRRQVAVGRLVTAAGSFGLVLWILLTGLEGLSGALAVVCSALVVGIGFSLGGPAQQALVPALVRPNELAPAVALNAAPFSIGRAGGPAIGAILVTTVGPAAAFAVAGAGNLFFAVIVLLIRIHPVERGQGRDLSVRAGVRHIKGDRFLVSVLLGAAAVGVGADPVITLSPSIAAAMGGGERLVGALASSFGIGAALAFPFLGVLRRVLGLARMSVIGLSGLAAAMLALAVAPVPAAAFVVMGVGGAGMTLAVTSLSTQVQQRVPEELRGRVMSVWMVAFLGSRPLAAGMNGTLADTLGVSTALAVVAVIGFSAAWFVRPPRLARLERRAAPQP